MWRDGVVLRLAKSGSSTVEGGFSSFLILGSSARQAGHPPSSIADLALIHATISLTAALLRYISHSVRRLLWVRAAIRTVVPSPWISMILPAASSSRCPAVSRENAFRLSDPLCCAS